jgi:hypothetical protein
VSNTNKYLSKVYGDSYLKQLKSEEQEEKNRLLREQRELEKMKREQQKQVQEEKTRLKKQEHQSRLAQNNKKKETDMSVKLKKKITTMAEQRPAFLTGPFIPYPENLIKSFPQQEAINQIESNVSLVTIIPRDSSTSSKTNDLIKQELPSLSINPTPQQTKPSQNLNETIEIFKDEPLSSVSPRKHKDTVNSDQLNLNQEGTGIHLPGYKPEQASTNRPTNTYFQNIPLGNLSYETSEFGRTRDVLETNALQWLEQELLAHFIYQLASGEQRTREQDNVPQLYEEVLSDENSEEPNGEIRKKTLDLAFLNKFYLNLVFRLKSEYDWQKRFSIIRRFGLANRSESCRDFSSRSS